MKKILMMALGLVVSLGLMTACDDDEDIRAGDVPTAVQRMFEEKYPGTRATWEKDKGNYKAEFRLDGREANAWFSDAKWIGTEIDLLESDLPVAVKDYVAANHAGYRIDDVDLVQTPDREYYKLELEKNGKRDLQLHITKDGKRLN